MKKTGSRMFDYKYCNVLYVNVIFSGQKLFKFDLFSFFFQNLRLRFAVVCIIDSVHCTALLLLLSAVSGNRSTSFTSYLLTGSLFFAGAFYYSVFHF